MIYTPSAGTPCDYIDSQWRKREPARFGPGNFVLDRPLQTPYIGGVQLFGAGPGDYLLAGRPNHPLRGSATYFTLAHSEPTIHVTASDFHFAGFTMLGRGGDGIIVAQENRKGLGTGKGLVERVEFAEFRYATRAGLEPTEHNNDETTFYRCKFKKGQWAYRQTNSQAMGNVFSNCLFATDLENVCEIDGGGHLKLVDCLFFGQTVLTFSDHNPVKYRVGPNNRKQYIIRPKVDNAHRGKFRYVNTVGDCWATVIVDEPMVSGQPAMESVLGENVRLVVRDSEGGR